jgi:hypothetical protein
MGVLLKFPDIGIIRVRVQVVVIVEIAEIEKEGNIIEKKKRRNIVNHQVIVEVVLQKKRKKVKVKVKSPLKNPKVKVSQGAQVKKDLLLLLERNRFLLLQKNLL